MSTPRLAAHASRAFAPRAIVPGVPRVSDAEFLPELLCEEVGRLSIHEPHHRVQPHRTYRRDVPQSLRWSSGAGHVVHANADLS